MTTTITKKITRPPSPKSCFAELRPTVFTILCVSTGFHGPCGAHSALAVASSRASVVEEATTSGTTSREVGSSRDADATAIQRSINAGSEQRNADLILGQSKGLLFLLGSSFLCAFHDATSKYEASRNGPKRNAGWA